MCKNKQRCLDTKLLFYPRDTKLGLGYSSVNLKPSKLSDIIKSFGTLAFRL